MNSTNDNKTSNWIRQWIRQQQQQQDKSSFWIWQWIRQQQQQNWFQQKNEMLILGLCCHLLNSLLKTMSYSRKWQQNDNNNNNGYSNSSEKVFCSGYSTLSDSECTITALYSQLFLLIFSTWVNMSV